MAPWANQKQDSEETFMSKYNRVLIPIDLSLGRGALSPAVQQIVDASEAEITLLHVVDSQPRLGRNSHTMRLMTELELFGHRQFRQARINRRIEWGNPADCILNAIRAVRADVVLMSAGPAPLAGNALSPVATQVLSEAACPVLLEWPFSAPVNSAHTHPVCCAIEFDRGEEAVLREAAWAAEHMDAPLKLVHALVPGGANMPLLWDPAGRDREIARLRSRMEALRDRLAPGAGVHVGVGLPVSVFSRAIRAYRAALLVTGSAHEALLAAESECPVLYLPSAKRMRAGRPEAARPMALAAGRTA
jgi:nucleotide-binding universal stress UspA family protein